MKITLIIRANEAAYKAIWATAYNPQYNCPYMKCPLLYTI